MNILQGSLQHVSKYSSIYALVGWMVGCYEELRRFSDI